MYPETLYTKTKQVLDKVKKVQIIEGFYLAGGTGLALQFGHRKSIDLDFFTKTYPKKEILISALAYLKPKIIQDAPNTLDLTIEGVKVSFLEYKYPLLEKFTEYEGVKVAPPIDIACMKVTAISSRGSKKDFIDLHFILQKYSLEELFTAFNKKYQKVEFQKLHILKSLIYFSDAEADPSPDLIKEVNWNSVKENIAKTVKKYSEKII